LEALALLEQLFQECPEPSELASAYLQQAECLEALGRIEEAASAFMASVAANRRRTGVITTAPLEFGMFVVRNGLTGYYEEALSALEDTKMLTLFPSGQFMLHAAKAAIAAERGEMDNARQHARMALAAAAITDTGLRYHPKVGLVGKIEPRLHSRLVELAGA
jgi:tetratricopeptide (TPR) repeat protein